MDWEKDFDARPARTAFKAGSLALFVVGGLVVVGGGVGLLTLPFRAATGVAERTMNPDNVIANYEWFKRQVQDVRAMDEKIGVASVTLEAFEKSAGPRDAWKFDDRQEWGRLNSVLLGLRNQRASMVAEYNARSQMANRTLFKTNDLPETL